MMIHHLTHSALNSSRIRKLAAFVVICFLLTRCYGCKDPMVAEVEQAIAAGTDLDAPVPGPNPTQNALMHDAALAGSNEAVVLLLENGASVDIRDRGDRTPLHRAAQKGHLEMIRTLIAWGADVNACDDTLANTLGFAVSASRRQVETVALLIKEGASLEVKDVADATPLGLAVFQGKLETVEVLLDAGAEVNTSTDSGFTPLHLAAAIGRADVAETLIEYGADVNCRDAHNTTPLGVALHKYWRDDTNARRQKKVVKVLRDHGGIE